MVVLPPPRRASTHTHTSQPSLAPTFSGGMASFHRPYPLGPAAGAPPPPFLASSQPRERGSKTERRSGESQRTREGLWGRTWEVTRRRKGGGNTRGRKPLKVSPDRQQGVARAGQTLSPTEEAGSPTKRPSKRWLGGHVRVGATIPWLRALLPPQLLSGEGEDRNGGRHNPTAR